MKKIAYYQTMKKIMTFIILIIVSTSCATKWFMVGNKSEKIYRGVRVKGCENIITGDNIKLYNAKGEYFGYLTSTSNIIYYSMNDQVLGPGKLKKKNLTLITQHPYYVSETIKVKRSLRFGPLIGDLALTGLSGGWLAPVIGLDFFNNNIWKINNNYENINLSLRHTDDFYRKKLIEIDPTFFSNSNVVDPNRLELQKDILQRNLMWDGSEDLFCYYSGEKINIPPFDPSIKRFNRSKTIYVVVDWYPNDKHSFFNLQRIENRGIVGLDVTLDSLGRACYVYANNLSGFNEDKAGPLKLLKFASKENAEAWLSNKANNRNKKIRESELLLKMEEYRIKFPESPYLNDVTKKIYEYGYKVALNDNSKSALENYLISYPNSPYNSGIKEKLSKVKGLEQKKALSVGEIEYLISNYLGSEFTKKYEEEYLSSLFNEKSKNLKTLTDLNVLEKELKTFEKLSGKFIDDQLNRKLFELKKEYFAEALKQNSNLKEVCKLEHMSNSYYYYDKFNDTDTVQGQLRLITGVLLRDNKYLHGKYKIGNEIYNLKSGLLDGEYLKLGPDGSIIAQGNYKADPKNNRSIPIGNHLFTHSYKSSNGEVSSEKELIKFDQNGKPLSIEKTLNPNGQDMIKSHYEDYVKRGDNQIERHNFQGARKFYKKATEYECRALRWALYDNYALYPLLEKTLNPYYTSQNPIYSVIPIQQYKNDFNEKIKLLEKKQKEHAEEQAKLEKERAQNSQYSNSNSSSTNAEKPEGAILKDFLVSMSGRISYDGYGDGENYISGFTKNGGCYTRFNGVRGESAYGITRVNGDLTLKVVTRSNTYMFTVYKNLYEKWEFNLSNINNGDYNLRGTIWKNQF